MFGDKFFWIDFNDLIMTEKNVDSNENSLSIVNSFVLTKWSLTTVSHVSRKRSNAIKWWTWLIIFCLINIDQVLIKAFVFFFRFVELNNISKMKSQAKQLRCEWVYQEKKSSLISFLVQIENVARNHFIDFQSENWQCIDKNKSTFTTTTLDSMYR